jgi:sterol 3beta-glucosyltransferase
MAPNPETRSPPPPPTPPPSFADLGVGPAPIPRQQLTVENLAKAIDRAVTDPTMGQRARDLGQKIQAEDGVGSLVAIVNRIAQSA